MLCSIACSILEITTACSIGMLCTMLCTMLLSASASSVAILAQVSFTSYPATFSGVCISFLTTQLCASALDAAVAENAEKACWLASATGRLESINTRNVPSVATGVLSTSMQTRRLSLATWSTPLTVRLPCQALPLVLHRPKSPLGHPRSLRLALAILGLRP